MNIELIARVAHETNKSYCESINDFSQLNWEDAPQWQKDSAIKGVKYQLDNPDGHARAQHEAWLKDKLDEGWKYGEFKDAEKKENPCCVPYDELPIEQKVKDTLFVSVVRAMKVLL